MSDAYSSALSDACSGWQALKPTNRISVAQGAADTLVIRQPGAAGGPWSADETPYMVEPMNALTSRRHEAVVFIGPARTGKALDVDTPIPTPDGFTRMGDLVVGDEIFGPDGRTTNVVAAHPPQYERPCYEVEFSDGSKIVADGEHLWGVYREGRKTGGGGYEVLPTETLRSRIALGFDYCVKQSAPKHVPQVRQIVAIRSVPSRPVRCIGVDNERHLFLAGEGFVPTHNTASLLQGWMTHNVVNDPGDMLFLQMSKGKAREFSKTDIDRAIRNSPKVRAMLSPRAVDSNTFDIMFRHGMWLRVAWPTVDNVSGSTYRYVAVTDIDRIDNADNVDGEGPLFDLAKKRTTTFLSRGMTLVESSPGRPFEDPKWSPATPHEGPPCKGIVALYNRSTRERLYWQCPDCHEHFEAKPGLELFSMLPSMNELLEEVRSANIPALARKFSNVICPCCGSVLQHKDKQHFNKHGIWLPDGCALTKEREVVGTAIESTIRGFWLGGVAAFKQSWESIVTQYLYGLQDYALTGSEEKLKQTTNTDQGMPYMSRHLVEVSTGLATPRERGEVHLERYVAPEEARAVTVSVDVQGGQNARFDVQVHAVGIGGEQWVIDRFAIRDSKRPGATQDSFAPIDPASFPEDWDVLTERILLSTWRTPHENLEIHPLAVIVDSGGEDGVTHNAYSWYRKARKMGFGKRAFLYKGGSAPNAPDMRETMVGKIAGKGKDDIPLLHCNPNKLSDGVDAGLRRPTPGPGYIHFPAAQHPTLNPNGWVKPAFFDELEAEIRGKGGVWTQVRKRNETFDHCRMQRALHLRLGIYRVDNWNMVPATLAQLPQNSMVVTKETRREVKENEVVTPPPVADEVQARPVYRRQRRSSVAAL